MHRVLTAFLTGVLLLMAIPSFSFAYGSYGPQTAYDEKYFYWGSDAEPKNSRNGIDVVVDGTSVSFQSTKATISVDYNLIGDRGIDGFAVLANGVFVDMVDTYYDDTLSPPGYREVYYADFDISTQYIGSHAYFQVLGIHKETNGDSFVVAWSQETPTYSFKPLPVIDRDALEQLETQTGILYAILQKLEQLRADIMGKLDQVKDAVEKIYTVTPQTQAKFDAALAELQEKLPTEQMKDEINEVKDMLDNSANQIRNTPQELKFGQINWMGAVTTPAVDFTEVAAQVEKLRRILQIALWCEFFYFIIMYLRPRLTV